ncbi:uncharacterized protein SCHCODRAFT_01230336 [Schizophyllum commune H4-8]|uniref:uncharacterized protein n=1 Tax=Schizophyllum commune (strain H4-8 / FGSC 9210) TaxID=578458 RepID=UPI00215F2BFE|nr:uncharacterized protein SCHCODRAFT_01230336 [Schizophyllum commune H4-8]KAI5898371.1 hypothetical protein SCHCODRAFT_01230336 [Schizophyllum commune H4-8]
MAEQRRRRFLFLHHHFHGHLRVQRVRERLNIHHGTPGTSPRQSAIARRESASAVILSSKSTP